jgi:ElaA protein
MNISWHCLHFNELTLIELYEILKARQSVFSIEQKCVYLDADGHDQTAWHLLGMAYPDNKRTLACYARILPPGEKYLEASIGRVLTTSGYRGKSIGKQLIIYAIDNINSLFEGAPIKIGAQKYLKRFYENLGFTDLNQPYFEDNIPHLIMQRS